MKTPSLDPAPAWFFGLCLLALAAGGFAQNNPAPSIPAPSVPAPSVPAPSVPAPSIPAPSIPAPSVPAPSVPAPSVPATDAPASDAPAANAPAANVPAADVPRAPAPGIKTTADDAEPMTDVQFPNTPIPVILLEYERLTGKRVIRDTTVQDKNLIIQTSGKMTYPDAAEFIEKSFLLNGYAILPTDKPDQMTIIAYNTEKKPSSQGLPIYTTPFQLPETEQVVTYIMPLSYLPPEEAAELFSNVIVLNAYGKITALKSSSAIVITESSTNIKRLIELRDHLDVSQVMTIDQTFQLQRADAEDVVEALIDVLGLDQESGTSAGGNPQGGNPQAPNQANQQGQSDRGEVNLAVNDSSGSGLPSQARGSSSFAKPNAPKPRVRAIARANRVLVIATPQDMQYIESIINHLDAPVETSTYMRRQLHYIAVSDFLKIAGNVILRGAEDENSGEVSGGEEEEQNGLDNSGNNNDNNNGDSSSIGSNSGRSGGATGDLGNAGSDQAAAPQSVVIGKTLLIADNIQNMLIASGPPENLRQIEELLDSMDVRPVQIQISAIISQLTLGDDYEFAANLLRTLEQPSNGERFLNGSRFNGAGTLTSIPDPKLFNIANLTTPASLATTNSGLAFYGQINRYLDAHLSVLETTNRFKVLSRPTIYTVNNRQAVIETGQRVAVPRSTLSSLDTGGINNNNQTVTASIDYENVVLRIAVIPLINANGEITLQIQQKNDDIVGSTIIGGDEIPTIGTQSLGTTVMVPDGGTVLLGGLISEDDSKAQSGLPLFANLPLVGRVFGSTSDAINREELLIFIQPKVIRSEFDQTVIDNDLKDRTRIAQPAMEFATDADDNLDVFETQDFNSAEKRVFFFRDLFKKKPAVRAVPVD
jgi:type II secretion system protein D